MKIPELCDLLRKELFCGDYEYGFVLDGKKYRPDRSCGFDEEYYRCAKTVYRVQSPAVTVKEKIGTCVEAVLVMKSLLDARNVASKIWLLYNTKKNKVHTVLTFEAEGKTVYLELTPQSSKPCYGKEIVYPDEQTFLQEYTANHYEVSDVTDAIVIGQPPEFLLAKLK